MARKSGLKHWRFGLAVLVLAECATFGVPAFAPVTPAAAQFFDQRYPSLSRPRQRSGGFFDNLFGGGRSREEREIPNPYQHQYQQREAPAETSRAPAARKDSKPDQEPTTNIVVLGDSMADWLAYGLEDAFADAPEIGIVRKNKPYSGLLRYDAKNDLDWWHVARDLLANEKASYVVMMIGVGDRQNLREKDVAKEAEQQAKADAAKTEAAKADAAKTDAVKTDAAKSAQPNADQAKGNQAQTDQAKTDTEQAIIAPEPKRSDKRGGNAVIEFRTDEWAKVYSHRIDETIAALKSKGVPVFWVGLPSIRGTKSTADVSYLNDLYRARAEKAGAVYVDVWDGFVDEGGKFTTFGPDYEGQMRRLRSADGVYFTKYGARKLAHYVEREIRRTMANRGPIALPMGPTPAMPADGKSAVRPLAGPVVPLTTISGNNDELAGSGGGRADASATAVLMKGDAISPAPGRADDFIWPPGSERPKVEAPAAKPAAAISPQTSLSAPATPAVSPPVVAAPPPVAAKPEPAPISVARPEPSSEAKPVEAKPESKPRAAEVRPQPRQPQAADPRAPRPPQGIAQQPPPRRSDDGLFGRNGPFGFMR